MPRHINAAVAMATAVLLAVVHVPSVSAQQTEDEWAATMSELEAQEEERLSLSYSKLEDQAWVVIDPQDGGVLYSGDLYQRRSEPGFDIRAQVAPTPSFCLRLLANAELAQAVAEVRDPGPITAAEIGGCTEVLADSDSAFLPSVHVNDLFVVESEAMEYFVGEAARKSLQIEKLQKQNKKLKRQLKKAKGN